MTKQLSGWRVAIPVYQFAETSTGGIDATGSYSTGTPGVFTVQPSSTENFHLVRMMVQVRDAGSFDAEKYGNGITYTNGIIVRVQDDSGTITDLTGGNPIKTNSHWARHCYDTRVDTWGSGDNFLSARWTFIRNGYPLRVEGSKNERLEVVVQDVSTGLKAHTFFVGGYQERLEA